VNRCESVFLTVCAFLASRERTPDELRAEAIKRGPGVVPVSPIMVGALWAAAASPSLDYNSIRSSGGGSGSITEYASS
jgi:hypothetical protein